MSIDRHRPAGTERTRGRRHGQGIARSARFAALALAGALVALIGLPSGGATFANWPAYLRGETHSSYNAQASAITPADAGSLSRAWTFQADPPTVTGQPKAGFTASPTVYRGQVFIGANTGVFYALDETTGGVVWRDFYDAPIFVPRKTLGARGFTSTATVATDPSTGLATVYVAAADGYLYALDAGDGHVVWRSEVHVPSNTRSDYYNWSSPTVVGGHIYLGISSQGDRPLVPGGVAEFDQATSQKIATWLTLPTGKRGGSVWSSVAASTDGSNVWATTGNPTQLDVGLADSNSVVRLDGNGLARLDGWMVPPPAQDFDSDFGGSPTLFNASLAAGDTAMVGACNKNGVYYAWKRFDLAAGPVWSIQAGKPDSIGPGLCIAAAIWDGSHLFIAGNGTTINGVDYNGSIRELDPATGTPIWETGLPGTVLGSPTMSGGGVIAACTWGSGQPHKCYLVNANTGGILGHIAVGNSPSFGQPVFADSYIIASTANKGLFAFHPGP